MAADVREAKARLALQTEGPQPVEARGPGAGLGVHGSPPNSPPPPPGARRRRETSPDLPKKECHEKGTEKRRHGW
ncbi:Transcription Factor E2F1 [Manis pentadactyla]|nr:Transcription Factor E2F1 [Manis pentadactyla]